jgi:hypothetical protein
MEDEKLKQRAKDRLVILDRNLKLLRQTGGLVGLIKAHAVRCDLHKRAVCSGTTLTGLDFLIDELEDGRYVCMEILGAKKVPIVVERKLKLVVNNTGGK